MDLSTLTPTMIIGFAALIVVPLLPLVGLRQGVDLAGLVIDRLTGLFR